MSFYNATRANFDTMYSKLMQWRLDPSSMFSATPGVRGDGSVDLFEWHCRVRGTKNTLYKDGIFTVRLMFPRSDTEMMTAFFEPAIFHPNVSEFGRINAPSLRMWREFSIREMIVSLLCLMENPYIRGATNNMAKTLFEMNYKLYRTRVILNVLHEHNNEKTNDQQELFNN